MCFIEEILYVFPGGIRGGRGWRRQNGHKENPARRVGEKRTTNRALLGEEEEGASGSATSPSEEAKKEEEATKHSCLLKKYKSSSFDFSFGH